MLTLSIVLLVFSLVVFILAAFKLVAPTKVDLIGLGLAFYVAYVAIGHIAT